MGCSFLFNETTFEFPPPLPSQQLTTPSNFIFQATRSSAYLAMPTHSLDSVIFITLSLANTFNNRSPFRHLLPAHHTSQQAQLAFLHQTPVASPFFVPSTHSTIHTNIPLHFLPPQSTSSFHKRSRCIDIYPYHSFHRALLSPPNPPRPLQFHHSLDSSWVFHITHCTFVTLLSSPPLHIPFVHLAELHTYHCSSPLVSHLAISNHSFLSYCSIPQDFTSCSSLSTRRTLANFHLLFQAPVHRHTSELTTSPNPA